MVRRTKILKKQELIKKIYETLRQKKYWEDKARYMEEYIKAYMNHEKIMSKLMDIDKKKLENYIEHCKKIYGYKEQKQEPKKKKEEQKQEQKEDVKSEKKEEESKENKSSKSKKSNTNKTK